MYSPKEMLTSAALHVVTQLFNIVSISPAKIVSPFQKESDLYQGEGRSRFYEVTLHLQQEEPERVNEIQEQEQQNTCDLCYDVITDERISKAQHQKKCYERTLEERAEERRSRS